MRDGFDVIRDVVSRDNHSVVIFTEQAAEQEVKGFSAFIAGPNLGIEIWDPIL